MTQIASSTPTYDADGYVTNDFLHTYTWDAYGRPVTIDGVGVTYDALGRMVERTNSGSYTQFVWSPTGWKLAYTNGQTLVQGNFPLPAGAVVAYNSSGLLVYHHADWLGSYRLASTPSRTVYWDGAYAPFGEPYAQSGGGVDLSFTGMNQDTALNLYDFPAREYGIQGRWPSPDPAGLSAVDPSAPQSWNRYAYVNNSPLTMTDPTGLDPCDSDASCGPGDPGSPSFCGWDPCGTGLPPDLPIPVVTQMGGFGPSRFTPPGSNSIFACNPYQSCPGVYVPSIDYSWMGLLNWGLGLPDPCSAWYVGCVNDAGTSGTWQTIKNLARKIGSTCATNGKVLKADAETALDVFGAIPVAGNIAHGIQLGAGFVSAGLSLSGNLTGAAVSAGTLGLSIADSEKLTSNIALHGTELVPVFGNFVSGVSALNDVVGKEGVINSFKVCRNGTN